VTRNNFLNITKNSSLSRSLLIVVTNEIFSIPFLEDLERIGRLLNLRKHKKV